jgi:hypothetical protein
VTTAKSAASKAAAREVGAAAVKAAGTVSAAESAARERGRGCCEHNGQTGRADRSNFCHDCFSW